MSFKDKLAGYDVNGSVVVPAEGSLLSWNNTLKYLQFRTLQNALLSEYASIISPAGVRSMPRALRTKSGVPSACSRFFRR